METVTVLPHDQVYVRLACEPAVWREIQEHFSYELPGARFTPAYKRGWDGIVRLAKKGFLYRGLLEELARLCSERGWALDSRLEDAPRRTAWSPRELDLPRGFELRDYQEAAIKHALSRGRCVLLSPTSSGKSLVIYAVALRHARTLVIVPTVNLVRQLSKDFRDYGYKGGLHEVSAGVDPYSTEPVVVSTWQSLARVEDKREFMNSFDAIVVDECHRAAAKSLVALMEAATDVENRFGLTGTLDGTQVNEMLLTGLFGPVERVTTTRELMDRGLVSQARVSVLALRHPERARRASQGRTYQEEIDYLVGCVPRNKFLARLAAGLRGNVLVLYTRVETHGAVLFDMIREEAPDREVRFIHGGVDGDEREEARDLVASSDDAIVVASYGTFSTGVNMPRVRHVVFASPYKSRVVVLQSIGRGLRLAAGKERCDVYDAADDLSYGNWRNHTLRHMHERVRTYARERIDYGVYEIDLPETASLDRVLNNADESDSGAPSE